MPIATTSRLGAIEDDLVLALALLREAEPTVWRSPAATAYRERLDHLDDLVRRLVSVCRLAAPEVAGALARPAPEDPLLSITSLAGCSSWAATPW